MIHNPISGLVFENLTGHRYYSASSIALFFLLLIGYFIAWPIEMTDTDREFPVRLRSGKKFAGGEAGGQTFPEPPGRREAGSG